MGNKIEFKDIIRIFLRNIDKDIHAIVTSPLTASRIIEEIKIEYSDHIDFGSVNNFMGIALMETDAIKGDYAISFNSTEEAARFVNRANNLIKSNIHDKSINNIYKIHRNIEQSPSYTPPPFPEHQGGAFYFNSQKN